MKFLIIPEDQTLDGYILKPIVEAIAADLGVRGRVDVLPEPRLRGAGDALDAELIGEIVADNPMVDVFLLVVDRDCDRQNNQAKAEARRQEHPDKLIACVAIQEVEVWLLALYKDELGAPWQQVREHCDPKERWADPLLRRLGTNGPGGGRKLAMRALQGKLRSLLSLCEELEGLKQAIASARAKSA